MGRKFHDELMDELMNQWMTFVFLLSVFFRNIFQVPYFPMASVDDKTPASPAWALRLLSSSVLKKRKSGGCVVEREKCGARMVDEQNVTKLKNEHNMLD